MKHRLIIRRDGALEWLNPPPFPIPIEGQKRERYSEILPLDPWQRLVFVALRKLFGEDGKVAAWTRTWLCVWIGRILLGPHKGEEFISPFRAAIVQWEQEKFFK
jgi:hypothetical protein